MRPGRSRCQPAQAVRQDDAGGRGSVEPEGIQAAQGMRQREIEEQDRIQRKQRPGQREASPVVVAGKLVADQEGAEKRRHQPGAEVSGTLEVEDEERREDAAEEELQQEIGRLPERALKRPARDFSAVGAVMPSASRRASHSVSSAAPSRKAPRRQKSMTRMRWPMVSASQAKPPRKAATGYRRRSAAAIRGALNKGAARQTPTRCARRGPGRRARAGRAVGTGGALRSLRQTVVAVVPAAMAFEAIAEEGSPQRQGITGRGLAIVPS
jgi:hypothetical protein